ncbi:MAG: sugar transferase [Clostridia bacterium]|nr:sugar transferase [Clostridia bacterium]MBO7318728.1 sugar transferase [Clostridia bacterium]
MMNKRYLREKSILYLFKVAITLLMTGSIFLIWFFYYNPIIKLPFYEKGHYLMTVVFTAIYLVFTRIYGGFMVGTASVLDLIFSQIIATGFTVGSSYAIFTLLSYKLVNPIPLIIFFFAFSVVAALWCLVADKVYFKLHKAKKTIVIFGNKESYESLKGIKGMTKRFVVEETYDCEKTTLEFLFDKVNGFDAVFMCGVPSDYRNEILKYCIANNIACFIKPKISDTIIRGGKTIQMMNVPVYRCKRGDTGLIYLAMKRFFDVVLSLIAIVISSPFMLVTALAIKLYDGGKVFYRQVRLTKDAKEFEVIKFRSMIQDAEKDGVARLAKDGDSRITPVGKIIRMLRLDELPQLFNILKGDMSFVGPRPERPEIAKQYEKDMPEFALRLQVKAGLTGYAQVYGKYNTPPYDKVQMDLMYVANQSIIEDLKLMLMTFKILFIPSSTEGVSDDQTTAKKD